MSREDFLSYYEYLKVYSHVQHREKFDYAKTVKKIRINIHSAKWNTLEKQGQYMVSVGSMSNTCGCGWGSDPEEFIKKWGDYDKALEQVQGLIKCAGGQTEEEPQMRIGGI